MVIGSSLFSVPVSIVPGSASCAEVAFKPGLRYVPDPVLNDVGRIRKYRPEPMIILVRFFMRF